MIRTITVFDETYHRHITYKHHLIPSVSFQAHQLSMWFISRWYRIIFVRNLFIKNHEFPKRINWRCVEHTVEPIDCYIICPNSLSKLNVTGNPRVHTYKSQRYIAQNGMFSVICIWSMRIRNLYLQYCSLMYLFEIECKFSFSHFLFMPT